MRKLPHVARLLGLFLAAVGPTRLSDLTGIFTAVEGAVQLAGPGVQGSPLAHPWQVIRNGVTVLIPEGASAWVVCSNHRFILISKPGSWSLNEQNCAAGKELTVGQYALVAPKAGRFRVVEGLLTLEREIRASEEDDTLAPLVLFPRNTMLRSPRPTVAWRRVPAATEYRVEWSGRHGAYEERLKSGDVACAPALDGAELCSLPWRASRPDLSPGETLFLRIAARQGTAQPWRWSESVEIRTPIPSNASALASRIGDLETFGFRGPGLVVARAGLLAREGFYTEAALDYRQALAATPTAELRITLADVYLTIGLVNLAEPLYREALRDSSPYIHAAAAFGIARVEYARGHFREAAMAFRQASTIYESQQMMEELEAAREAESKAAARSPR